MDCLFSGQFINLSGISSLQTQEPFLMVVQDILSVGGILSLVLKLHL